MAKFAKCESCGKEAPLHQPMDSDPQGWINATEHHDTLPDRDFLACSPICMEQLMKKLRGEKLGPVTTKTQ